MPEHSPLLEPPVVTAAGPKVTKIILILVALIYGLLLLLLSWESPTGMYNSPDEVANATFIQGLANDGHLLRPAVRPDLPSSVTPRSMLRSGNFYLPVSFVSFPVFAGLFAMLFTTKGILFLFAGLGFLSLLAWYGFLKPIFGDKIAMLSVFLAAVHPAILYWAQRPFLPNAWFLIFLFFSLYFIGRALGMRQNILPADGVNLEKPTLEQKKVRHVIFSILAGLTFGITIALRPQEGIWLVGVPLYLLLVPCLRRRMPLIFFAISALVPLGGLLLLQKYIYGSPLYTGYHLTPPGSSLLELLRNFIFPFGLNLSNVESVLYSYWLDIFWWFMILAVIGAVFPWVKKEGKLLKRLRWWVAGVLLIGIWLIVFYGSFVVRDRLDTVPSMATSFTRYFLPFYALGLPIVAYALFRIRQRFGRFIASTLVIMMVVLSIETVFWNTDESIVSVVGVLERNQEVLAVAEKIIPSDAVILTERSDKIYFPHWEVVTRFKSFVWEDFAELRGLNLYYETFADADFVNQENEKFWSRYGLQAVGRTDLGAQHYLYKLELLN